MSFTEVPTPQQLVSLAGEQQGVEKQQEEILKEVSTVQPTVIDLAEDPTVAKDLAEDHTVAKDPVPSEDPVPSASDSDEEEVVVDLKRKRANAAISRREKRLKEMSEEARQQFFEAERKFKEADECRIEQRNQMKLLMANPKLSEAERLLNRAERNLRKRQKKALVSAPIEEDLAQLFLKHNIDVSVKEVEVKEGKKRTILCYNGKPVSPSMKSSTTLKHLVVAMLDALHGDAIQKAWTCTGDDDKDTAYKTLVKEKLGVSCCSVQTKEAIFKTFAKNFLKLALELETLNRSKHFKGVTMIRHLVEKAKKEQVEGGEYQQCLASLDEADICLYTERHDFVFKEVNDNLSLSLPFITLITDLIDQNFDKITAAAKVTQSTA